MLKILYAGCTDLSPAISAQFIVNMCFTTQKREKFTKPPILGVRGHSKSSTLTPLKSSSLVHVMIGMSVPICNCFHVRRASISKITTF